MGNSDLPAWFVVCAIALIATPLRVASAQAPPLEQLAQGLDIDPGGISVSGVSSGAYMAQQFHVAHSSSIRGVGVVAGGPYDCAEGSYFWSSFDITGLYAALHVCSATGLFGVFNGPPDVRLSIEATHSAARTGTIDDPVNLAGDRIWLFSGANDDKIPGPVVDSTRTYYESFVDTDRIRYEQHPDASHAMITDDFGSACETNESPYINDCDFDAARELLQHLYFPAVLAGNAEAADPARIFGFDQSAFFDPGDERISMGETAYVYLPANCAAGERCRLHVAFHGCQQYPQAIGDAFYTGAGYNQVAETNDIVVLYPQTRAWSDSVFFGYRENPRGCWDWWGYSGENFSRRSGKQIRAVAGMINILLGRETLPPN